MQKDDATKLRGLNQAEIAQWLDELRQELFNLRFQYATRRLTNTARIREVRRDIARLLTRQRELELLAERAPQAQQTETR